MLYAPMMQPVSKRRWVELGTRGCDPVPDIQELSSRRQGESGVWMLEPCVSGTRTVFKLSEGTGCQDHRPVHVSWTQRPCTELCMRLLLLSGNDRLWHFGISSQIICLVHNLWYSATQILSMCWVPPFWSFSVYVKKNKYELGPIIPLVLVDFVG